MAWSIALVLLLPEMPAGAADPAGPAQAWREVEHLTKTVKGLPVVVLPSTPGTVTVAPSQTLTIEQLRGVELDPDPPRLGPPNDAFRELTAHLLSAENPPYVARDIGPFRFRHLDVEFHYDGSRQSTWPICEYATTHGFNRLSLYKVNTTNWGHLPAGTDWAKVSGYYWANWFKAHQLEPNRWDQLAEAAERGERLIPEGALKPNAAFSRYMVDLEFGGLLPADDLRRQPWYPADAGEATRAAFEKRYYAGYALAFSEPGRAAHRDGWQTVSIYAWQSFRQTWYGLDPRIQLDPTTPWVRHFLDSIYDAYDILHLDGYCYEWSPRNVAFALRTADEGRSYVQTRPTPKPVRLYASTVILNKPACGPWLRVQPLPNEEMRAIVALQFFTGVDGIIQWCFAGNNDHTRPPDLMRFADKPQATNVVQVGHTFAARDAAGTAHAFKRYEFLRVQNVDTNTGTASFYRIRADTRLEDQPPDRESVCALPCAELGAVLRPVSEPVAAFIEGLALVRPLEYTLRHGEPKQDIDMQRAWSEILPIVRRVTLGNLHVLATYDPAVVHGGAPRRITLDDFGGNKGLTLVLPADEQVRLVLLKSPASE